MDIFNIFATNNFCLMSWNDFVYGLGEVIEATFVILETLGNIPNVLFTLVIVIATAFWLNELKKYRRRSEETGEME